MSLQDKTIFITGASRGIGFAIAKKAASEGANIAIAAKTTEPHPKLPGTIYTAAEEIETLGGKALPLKVDIRHEEEVLNAVKKTADHFGGIDILINNASAINLTNTENTPMKRYDLMMGVNARGTYMCSQACIPYLKEAENPHILNLSPPLNLDPKWFKDNLAYTMAKYGMSMCVLGLAAELEKYSIGVNALWPRTAIYTAAIVMLGGQVTADHCRKPEIVADAAIEILNKSSKECTGNFFIDDEVLAEKGVKDLSVYNQTSNPNLMADFFL